MLAQPYSMSAEAVKASDGEKCIYPRIRLGWKTQAIRLPAQGLDSAPARVRPARKKQHKKMSPRS